MFPYLSSPLLIHFLKLLKIAPVVVQLEVVQVDDVGCDAVEEVAVV